MEVHCHGICVEVDDRCRLRTKYTYCAVLRCADTPSVPCLAGDWAGQFPVIFNIVGGSGAYDGVTGGTATFNSDKSIDLVLIK